MWRWDQERGGNRLDHMWSWDQVHVGNRPDYMWSWDQVHVGNIGLHVCGLGIMYMLGTG